MVRYITSEDDSIIILSSVVITLMFSQYIGNVALLIPFITPIIMILSLVIINVFVISNISYKSSKKILQNIIHKNTIILKSDSIGSARTIGTELIPIIIVNPEGFSTDEQMIGAINHEVGHIKNNHVLKNIILKSIIILIIVSILILLSINIISIIITVFILYLSSYIIGTIRFYQELEAENYSKNINKNYIEDMRKEYKSNKDYESDNIHPEPEQFINLTDE